MKFTLIATGESKLILTSTGDAAKRGRGRIGLVREVTVDVVAANGLEGILDVGAVRAYSFLRVEKCEKFGRFAQGSQNLYFWETGGIRGHA